MDLRNKIIPMLHGAQRYILAGKPTDNPKRGIWLLHALTEKCEYSLWNIEIEEQDDGRKLVLWPYEGDDSEALMLELMEDFIEDTCKE